MQYLRSQIIAHTPNTRLDLASTHDQIKLHNLRQQQSTIGLASENMFAGQLTKE